MRRKHTKLGLSPSDCNMFEGNTTDRLPIDKKQFLSGLTQLINKAINQIMSTPEFVGLGSSTKPRIGGALKKLGANIKRDANNTLPQQPTYEDVKVFYKAAILKIEALDILNAGRVSHVVRKVVLESVGEDVEFVQELRDPAARAAANPAPPPPPPPPPTPTERDEDREGEDGDEVHNVEVSPVLSHTEQSEAERMAQDSIRIFVAGAFITALQTAHEALPQPLVWTEDGDVDERTLNILSEFLRNIFQQADALIRRHIRAEACACNYQRLAAGLQTIDVRLNAVAGQRDVSRTTSFAASERSKGRREKLAPIDVLLESHPEIKSALQNWLSGIATQLGQAAAEAVHVLREDKEDTDPLIAEDLADLPDVHKEAAAQWGVYLNSFAALSPQKWEAFEQGTWTPTPAEVCILQTATDAESARQQIIRDCFGGKVAIAPTLEVVKAAYQEEQEKIAAERQAGDGDSEEMPSPTTQTEPEKAPEGEYAKLLTDTQELVAAINEKTPESGGRGDWLAIEMIAAAHAKLTSLAREGANPAAAQVCASILETVSNMFKVHYSDGGKKHVKQNVSWEEAVRSMARMLEKVRKVTASADSRRQIPLGELPEDMQSTVQRFEELPARKTAGVQTKVASHALIEALNESAFRIPLQRIQNAKGGNKLMIRRGEEPAISKKGLEIVLVLCRLQADYWDASDADGLKFKSKTTSPVPAAFDRIEEILSGVQQDATQSDKSDDSGTSAPATATPVPEPASVETREDGPSLKEQIAAMHRKLTATAGLQEWDAVLPHMAAGPDAAKSVLDLHNALKDNVERIRQSLQNALTELTELLEEEVAEDEAVTPALSLEELNADLGTAGALIDAGKKAKEKAAKTSALEQTAANLAKQLAELKRQIAELKGGK